MAVCQLLHLWLTHRSRGQARSYESGCGALKAGAVSGYFTEE